MSCIDETLNPGTWRAAGIRPYGWVRTIQLALNKERTAVGPLQSALRAASFPREAFGGAVSCSHSTGCYPSGNVEGRQIAAPYEGRGFWWVPFN